MSSNSAPLTASDVPVMFRNGSDVSRDLRDAGSATETTSAVPVGCRPGEVEPKPDELAREPVVSAEPAGCRPDIMTAREAEPVGEGSSEHAQAGPSDPSPHEIKTPAESIKSRRDFEAFLRASGFSRSVAKSLASSGWTENEETEPDDDDDFIAHAGELIRLLREPVGGSNV